MSREQEELTKNHEEAVKQAIAEGRKLAQQKKLRAYVDAAKEHIAEERFEDAMKEITKIYLVNPDDESAKVLEKRIHDGRQAQVARNESTQRWREEHLRKVEALQKEIADYSVKEREEEEKRAIRKSKIDIVLKRVEELYKHRQYDKARAEIETVYAIDPSSSRAQDFEMDILTDLNRREEARKVFEQRTNRGAIWKREEDTRERALNERRSVLRREAVALYRSFLKHTWSEGKPGKEELALLAAVRSSLVISDADHGVMEKNIRFEMYTDTLRTMLETNSSFSILSATEDQRTALDITLDQHTGIMENLLKERESSER